VFRGDRMALLRKNRQLTQEQVSKEIKVTKAAVSNYETGQSAPSNETLVALADLFNVYTDYLLGRTNVASPSGMSEDSSFLILKELIKKYSIDLTDPRNKIMLEKMIKLTHEDI